MAEYIERETVISLFDADKWQGEVCINAVKELPAADVVSVIRCKDCKYYNRNLGGEKKTCIYFAYTTHALEEECRVGEDDFCSHAEKKF